MIEGYSPLARPIIEWADPKKLLPYTDDLVLVVVSGCVGNTVFDNGIALATYFDECEGPGFWELVEFPDEYDGFEVHYWSPLPEVPKKEAAPVKAPESVVHCIDCVHYNVARLLCRSDNLNGYTPSDGFCHNGKRRARG